MFKADLSVTKVSSYFAEAKQAGVMKTTVGMDLLLLESPSAPIWAVLRSEAAL
jgi:hypothetical protein